MLAVIDPGNISGGLPAPPSKSIAQRAFSAALLHQGITIIHHAGNSADEQAALQIIQQLGAQADVAHLEGVPHLTYLTITSKGVNPITNTINCNESGLAARLFTPIAALSEHAITIQGTGTLLHRPMEGFGDVLPALNVKLTDFNGSVPFTIQGPIQAASITVDAKSGSQFLSGLLFALSSCATTPITVTVTELKSKPYIDMTLEMLERFGKVISHKNYKEFYIDPAQFVHKGTVEINIEADWSSAAYFLVAGAIAGEVTIHNLNINSAQADKAIIEVLRNAGAVMKFDEHSINIKKGPLQAFDFDATHCPDLFPVLAILAACCEGESYIAGVHRLFHKESNRAESITEMLQDFAVPYSIEDDALCITGVRKLQGTVIDGYKDHRIVMAAAIGALRANGPVEIFHAEAVNKSYPAFWEDLILCGGKCNLR